MGLHIIVDGYNMIRSSPSLSSREALSMEDGRQALLARLSDYKRIKKWPITVVFDAGGAVGDGSRMENVKNIRVLYSRYGQSADQVIRDMAEEKGPQALVVTSDVPLATYVEKQGALVIASREFESRIEMAFYMEAKGVLGGETSEERPVKPKKGPKHRRPKASRKKNARLRKI